MVDTDARVARVGHKAVAARKPQGIAGDGDRGDPGRIERRGAPFCGRLQRLA
jgi:hypothetical protein